MLAAADTATRTPDTSVQRDLARTRQPRVGFRAMTRAGRRTQDDAADAAEARHKGLGESWRTSEPGRTQRDSHANSCGRGEACARSSRRRSRTQSGERGVDDTMQLRSGRRA